MKIYVPQPELLARNAKPRPKRLIVQGVLMFLVYLAISFLWHERGEGIWELVAGSFFFTLVMSIFLIVLGKRTNSNLAVYIDDGKIATKMGSMNLRTLAFKDARSVVEKKENLLRGGGLLLSRYAGVGRFLWGGVWVSDFMEDYAEIRSIVAAKVPPDVEWRGGSRPVSQPVQA